MKITKLETLRLEEFPNLLWLRLESDAGIAGLGETHRAAPSVEAYVHEFIVPRVLGKDPLELERLTRSLTGYLGFRGSGVETRAISAFDIALWDHYARVVNQPLYQVLGGASRERIRTYNTCAGYRYIRDTRGQTSANWGLGGKPAGPYEDLDAFLHRADELAQSLLEQGIDGMKIWPFDTYAEATEGMHISGADLHAALEPFRQIRRAVGHKMDIMVEFHSLWRLPPAQRIAQALGEFDTYWHEDPIRMDSLALLKAYAPYSKAPICGSEILAGRWSFKDLLETGVAGIVMFDLAWCGGVAEARRIAALADAWSFRRAARLHRADRVPRLAPLFHLRAERARPGIGARVLYRLVQGARHARAAAQPRQLRASAGTGTRRRAAARAVEAPRCERALKHALKAGVRS